MKLFRKPLFIALVYGFAAGLVAAAVLALMGGVQRVLWSHGAADSRLYIFAVIMAGGALIAWIQHLRHGGSEQDGNLARQLAELHDPVAIKRRDMLLIAASAIIAIGFGGAVGPEAGLLAVVAECSALVSLRLARSQAEERLIRDTGAVAALSGCYAAPPGAAVLVDEPDSRPNDGQPTPLTLKFLAGVSGMAGFWLAHKLLTGSSFQALPLPAHQPDGSDILLALPAAAAGAALGLLSVWLHRRVPAALAHLAATPVRRILLGSALFALMAACMPLLRFSGHHELEHALEHGIHQSVWALLGLATAKVLAMNLCLASGWRGGEIFPAIFAAAALAAGLHLLIPAIPLTVAVMGAAGAACVVCMGKPVAVLLILLLITGTGAPGALFTGVLIGYCARQRWCTNAGEM